MKKTKKETVIQSQITETSDIKIEKITKVFSDTNKRKCKWRRNNNR